MRRLRHIAAKPSEWVVVHRNSNGGSGGSGGSGGGGGGQYAWLFLLGAVAIFVCWLAYKIFIWTVEIIQSVIHWVAEFLITATPFLLLAGILIVIAVAVVKNRN